MNGHATLFREVNERIAELAVSWDRGALRGFLCECDARDCTQVIELTLDEYEAVRGHPTRFVVAAGHERAEGISVVARRDGHLVIETLGGLRREAEDSDPRSEDPAEQDVRRGSGLAETAGSLRSTTAP